MWFVYNAPYGEQNLMNIVAAAIYSYNSIETTEIEINCKKMITIKQANLTCCNWLEISCYSLATKQLQSCKKNLLILFIRILILKPLSLDRSKLLKKYLRHTCTCVRVSAYECGFLSFRMETSSSRSQLFSFPFGCIKCQLWQWWRTETERQKKGRSMKRRRWDWSMTMIDHQIKNIIISCKVVFESQQDRPLNLDYWAHGFYVRIFQCTRSLTIGDGWN